MSRPLSSRITITGTTARSIAIAALLGTTMLVGPLTTALADDVVATAPKEWAQATSPPAVAEATQTKAETVEERITNLHAALKITPDEDAKWNNVAHAMRENAAAMEKLVAEKTTHAPQNMTAVQDLKMYEKFAQAHVDGLKNLISSFETLYSAMPDAQKKLADDVFSNFGRERAAPHG